MIHLNKFIASFTLLLMIASAHAIGPVENLESDVAVESLENIVTLIRRADFNREQNEFKRQKEFLKEQELLYPESGISDDPEMAAKTILARTFRPDPHKFRPQLLKEKKNSFKMAGERMQIDVPRNNRGKINIRNKRKNALNEEKDMSFAIGLPNGKGKNGRKAKKRMEGKMALDNTIVYTAESDDTDYAVQVLDGSLRILAVLNNQQAPTEFVYPLYLLGGDSVEEDADSGYVLIYDIERNLKAFISSAWAIDANGQSIDTHYEIRGTDLVQIVNHLDANASYPIVADPVAGIDLVDRAEWRGNRLHVFPTIAGRIFSAAYAGQAGWLEVQSFVNVNLHGNAAGLRDQYICHVMCAWWQPREYGLEPWRPNVGLTRTLAAACNPTSHSGTIQ